MHSPTATVNVMASSKFVFTVSATQTVMGKTRLAWEQTGIQRRTVGGIDLGASRRACTQSETEGVGQTVLNAVGEPQRRVHGGGGAR